MDKIYQHKECGYASEMEKFANNSCPNCPQSTKDTLELVEVKNTKITMCSRCFMIRTPGPRCDNCGKLDFIGKSTYLLSFLMPLIIGHFLIGNSNFWNFIGLVLVLIGSIITILHIRSIVTEYTQSSKCIKCGKIIPIDATECNHCGFFHGKNLIIDIWQIVILILLGIILLILNKRPEINAIGIGSILAGLTIVKKMKYMRKLIK